MVTYTTTTLRHRFSFTVLFLLLFAVAGFAQGGNKVPPLPGNGGTIGGFEIDADFRPGVIPPFWTASAGYTPSYTPTGTGLDWRSVLTKNSSNILIPGLTADKRAVWTVDGNWGNNSTKPEIKSFAGTSNKNGDPIGAGQSPYLLQDGGTGPAKNDITNTFLHTRDVMINGVKNTFLYVAAETRSTSGASYIDFEYNQKGVQITSANQLVGKGLVNGRTPGDFIIVANYEIGGSTPRVGVRVWLANGTWSEELPTATLDARMANNASADVPALVESPNANRSSYTDNGAASATTFTLQLTEGGLNITALDDFADLNLCSPEATMTIKTRSSPSFTAELKDLDVVPFTLIPGPPGTNVSQTACPTTPGGTTANFDLTDKNDDVTSDATATVEWFTTYQGGVFSGAINTPGSYSSSGGKVFAKITGTSGCISAAENTLTVRTSPARPAVTYNPPACNASTFSVEVTCPTGTGYTYKLNGGTAQSSTTFSGIAAGAGFSITVIDPNGCESLPTTCTNYANYTCPTTTTKATTPDKEEQVEATKAQRVHDINARIGGATKVLATPNPFTDKVRFTLQSEVSGQGSLEIYNTVGQKVATVYQGHVEAGRVLNREYLVPASQRQNLIYIFRVGEQKTTGKLLNW